jgi:hypothetical protein
MFGSKSNFFRRSIWDLHNDRGSVVSYLFLKGYYGIEIGVYLKAYDYFVLNPNAYDGATIVKDLIDLHGLDLDAMLHDYHYGCHGVASNFVTKWKADWLYAKGQERKGKGQYSAFSRFVGLTITGIGFVPYALLKRGKIAANRKKEFLEEYEILIK